MRQGLIAWCNALSTLYPDDAELASARAQLRERGFVPPAPLELPEGDAAEVRARLARRTPEELAELASALVTLPDPAAEPERAAAAMELLLAIGSEAARAERLLGQLDGASPAPSLADLALWRFRLGAGRLDDGARAEASRWEALLEPVRAVPAVAPEALRLAASGWLAAMDTSALTGAEWLVPVLDGRRVVNAPLARLRRPALAAPDALGPAFSWLEEAAALEDTGDAPAFGAEALIAAADRADRAGDIDAGTQHLIDAAAAATDDSIELALNARAALLVDPSLGAGAAAAQTALARRSVPRPKVTPPAAPRRDWTGRLLALGDGAAPTDGDLGLFESIGASERAANGWLARGDLPALLQATRLADALDADARRSLTAALAEHAPEDEVTLAGSADARAAACARWGLLPPGLERRIAFARLAATLPDAPPPSDAAAPEQDDDPHSVENRLAAAADLLDAGRHDAGVAVLVSLLRRVEADAALHRLAVLCARALEQDPPHTDLVEAVDKHLRAGDVAGAALAEALLANPTGAYALHETLLSVGSDVSRSDGYRCFALAAWLGIWSATGTPPSDAAIEPIARADAGLLALAAAKVAGATDPVAVAMAHLARLPLGAPDDARADDLLAMCLKQRAE